MLTRTEGIVLTSRKYGDADLIVTYLTIDKGIINAFAKSPRKTKSKFGSSLEPLTHAKLSLWGKEQSLPRITQSDIITSFHQVREDYNDFVNASRLIELLMSLLPPAIPNRELFVFFLNMLNMIKHSAQDQKHSLHLIGRIRLLALIGYAPRLRSCGKCGDGSIDFYPDAGTTLCRRCARTPDAAGRAFVRINNTLIQFYSHSIEWPMHISHRLKPQPQTVTDLSVLLDRHVGYLLSKKLVSAAFPVKAYS